MLLKATDFNVENFDTVSVKYPQLDVFAEALQVTAENIGSLSVELHTGIDYVDDRPQLKLRLDRGEGETPQDVFVRPNDWVVALWDQLYVFKDFDFKVTFAFTSLVPPPSHADWHKRVDKDPEPELMNTEVLTDDSSVRGNLEDVLPTDAWDNDLRRQ
jgi:hypothetical protein